MSRSRTPQGQSGYALLMALFVIFLVSISLALLASSLQIRLRLERENGETVLLSGLSDAAVAETLAHLSQDDFYAGVPRRDFGKGRIESRVVPLGANRYEIEATATYLERRRVVKAEVFRTPGMARVVRWRVPGPE